MRNETGRHAATSDREGGCMGRILTIALVLSMAAYAQAQPPMSNGDLVKLANSGLSDEFVLNLIDQQGSGLSSDVSSLIEMKRGGVNERLLSAVVRKRPSSEPLNSDS